MGYGEYGGGGSVKWLVRHGDDGVSRYDKDSKPKKDDGGDFTVLISTGLTKAKAMSITKFGDDGTITAVLPISQDPKTQIQIYWPPDKP